MAGREKKQLGNKQTPVKKETEKGTKGIDAPKQDDITTKGKECKGVQKGITQGKGSTETKSTGVRRSRNNSKNETVTKENSADSEQCLKGKLQGNVKKLSPKSKVGLRRSLNRSGSCQSGTDVSVKQTATKDSKRSQKPRLSRSKKVLKSRIRGETITAAATTVVTAAAAVVVTTTATSVTAAAAAVVVTTTATSVTSAAAATITTPLTAEFNSLSSRLQNAKLKRLGKLLGTGNVELRNGTRGRSSYITRSDSPARVLRNGKKRKLKDPSLLEGLDLGLPKRRRLLSTTRDGSGSEFGCKSEPIFDDRSSIAGSDVSFNDSPKLENGRGNWDSDCDSKAPLDDPKTEDTSSHISPNFSDSQSEKLSDSCLGKSISNKIAELINRNKFLDSIQKDLSPKQESADGLSHVNKVKSNEDVRPRSKVTKDSATDSNSNSNFCDIAQKKIKSESTELQACTTSSTDSVKTENKVLVTKEKLQIVNPVYRKLTTDKRIGIKELKHKNGQSPLEKNVKNIKEKYSRKFRDLKFLKKRPPKFFQALQSSSGLFYVVQNTTNSPFQTDDTKSILTSTDGVTNLVECGEKNMELVGSVDLPAVPSTSSALNTINTLAEESTVQVIDIKEEPENDCCPEKKVIALIPENVDIKNVSVSNIVCDKIPELNVKHEKDSVITNSRGDLVVNCVSNSCGVRRSSIDSENKTSLRMFNDAESNNVCKLKDISSCSMEENKDCDDATSINIKPDSGSSYLSNKDSRSSRMLSSVAKNSKCILGSGNGEASSTTEKLDESLFGDIYDWVDETDTTIISKRDNIKNSFSIAIDRKKFEEKTITYKDESIDDCQGITDNKDLSLDVSGDVSELKCSANTELIELAVNESNDSNEGKMHIPTLDSDQFNNRVLSAVEGDCENDDSSGCVRKSSRSSTRKTREAVLNCLKPKRSTSKNSSKLEGSEKVETELHSPCITEDDSTMDSIDVTLPSKVKDADENEERTEANSGDISELEVIISSIGNDCKKESELKKDEKDVEINSSVISAPSEIEIFHRSNEFPKQSNNENKLAEEVPAEDEEENSTKEIEEMEILGEDDFLCQELSEKIPETCPDSCAVSDIVDFTIVDSESVSNESYTAKEDICVDIGTKPCSTLDDEKSKTETKLPFQREEISLEEDITETSVEKEKAINSEKSAKVDQLGIDPDLFYNKTSKKNSDKPDTSMSSVSSEHCMEVDHANSKSEGIPQEVCISPDNKTDTEESKCHSESALEEPGDSGIKDSDKEPSQVFQISDEDKNCEFSEKPSLIVTENNDKQVDLKEIQSECPLEEKDVSPEELAVKESVLSALGLQPLRSQAVSCDRSKPSDNNYTGTLKIKLQRSSPEKRRQSLKYVLKQNKARQSSDDVDDKEEEYDDSEDISVEGDERVEYSISKETETPESSKEPFLFGAGCHKGQKGSYPYRFFDITSNPQLIAEKSIASDVQTVDSGSKDDKASAKTNASLVIPEKSSSFSIHPERLCSDVCSYCFGKFGSLDTPCHVAQLKSLERQRKILDAETHLTADSCLCDACYRHVDRKANCPSYKPKQKRQHPRSGSTQMKTPCCVQGCTQTAHHHVRRKWLIKLKRSIAKKVPIDIDKMPQHLPFPLCPKHYSWVDYFMVCGICKRRLTRNHMYPVGPEVTELNAALSADGIPVRLNDKLFLCKLCRYFASVRLKYKDPSQLAGNHKMFFQGYRKRILHFHDIEEEEDENTEETPPKPKRRKTKGISSTIVKADGDVDSGTKANEQTSQNYEQHSTDRCSPAIIDYCALGDGDRSGASTPMIDYSTLGSGTQNTFEDNSSNQKQVLKLEHVKPPKIKLKIGNGNSGKNGRMSSSPEGQQPGQSILLPERDGLEVTPVPDSVSRPFYPGEDQLPLHAEFDFQEKKDDAADKRREWERCIATIQFDKETKTMFQQFQRPYGNHSSFFRHLVLLEKYWRSGELILAPNASSRAVTYINSVQNRICSYEGRPWPSSFSHYGTTLTAASGSASVPQAMQSTPVPVIDLPLKRRLGGGVLTASEGSSKLRTVTCMPSVSISPQTVSFAPVVGPLVRSAIQARIQGFSSSPYTSPSPDQRKVRLSTAVVSTGSHIQPGRRLPNVLQLTAGGKSFSIVPRFQQFRQIQPYQPDFQKQQQLQESTPSFEPLICDVRSLATENGSSLWDQSAPETSSLKSQLNMPTKTPIMLLPKTEINATSNITIKPSTIVTPTGIILSRKPEISVTAITDNKEIALKPKIISIRKETISKSKLMPDKLDIARAKAALEKKDIVIQPAIPEQKDGLPNTKC